MDKNEQGDRRISKEEIRQEIGTEKRPERVSESAAQIDPQRVIQKMEEIHLITGIPSALMSRSKGVIRLLPMPPEESTEDYHVEILLSYMEEYRVPLQTPFITSIAGTTLIGILQLDEEYLAVLGPVAMHDVNIHRYLTYMSDRYSPRLVSHHMKLVYGSPRVDIHYFCNVAVHAVDFLCGRHITQQDIILSQNVEENGFAVLDEFIARNPISVKQLSFENEIYGMVKNGAVRELKEKVRDIQQSSYYYFQENGIYFLKFAFVFYASTLCHYATLGGAPGDEVRGILSTYLRKFRSTNGPESYWRLLPKFSIELCELVQKSKEQVYESDIVNRAVAYIRENIYAPITLEDLELHTHAASRTVTRHFRKYLGMTPAQYISDKKLEEAAYLLRQTDMKIVGIANLLHYSSQTHLSKNFARKYGCTPNEYRLRSKTEAR